MCTFCGNSWFPRICTKFLHQEISWNYSVLCSANNTTSCILTILFQSVLKYKSCGIRISRLVVFYKIDVLKIFSKFTGKQLCEGLFFNKATCLRPATFLKKRLRHKCFPVNIVKFFRTASLIGNLRSLLFRIPNFSSGRRKRDVEAVFLNRHGIKVKATLKGCLQKGVLQKNTNTYNMCNECTYEIQLPAE